MITPEQLASVDAYWRAANYITLAQLYLQSNAALRRPLVRGDVKPVVLGHWGVCPSLNFLYAHLNLASIELRQRIGLVVGPGHAAAALLANLFLEGTLSDSYKEFGQGPDGLECLVRAFGAESQFMTEIGPLMPGVIHQGGELGHSLAVAQGAALDCPGSVVVCFIGDGEAETGGIAGAWFGGRFLHPSTSGAVLPVVNLNGFKVGSASLFSQMSEHEIQAYLTGCGYRVLFVGTDHLEMHSAVIHCLSLIQTYRKAGETNSFAGPWPAIVLRTPKGWTGPREFDGAAIDGTYDNHKTPFKDAHRSDRQLTALDTWLHSYGLGECMDPDGRPSSLVLSNVPPPSFRIGSNFVGHPTARHIRFRFHDPSVHSIQAGKDFHVPTLPASHYVASLLRDNRGEAVFRVFSPDEVESCRFEAILNASTRTTPWRSAPNVARAAADGGITEVLNEPLCLGWLIGYLANGGHGVLLTYEAFAPIMTSMIIQYMRFLKQWNEAPWTHSIGSLNIVVTSLCWRNSYTHQNPDIIGLPLGKGFDGVEVYTPYDGNALLASLARGLQSRNKVNLFVASKTDLPLHAEYGQAVHDVDAGCVALDVGGANSHDPDVVLAVCGDYLLPETIAAISLAREQEPDLKVRLVYVTRLTSLGRNTGVSDELTDHDFTNLFTDQKPVLFAFTGYPIHLKGLLFDRPSPARFMIRGYSNCGPVNQHLLLTRLGLDRLSLSRALLGYAPGRETSTEVGRI